MVADLLSERMNDPRLFIEVHFDNKDKLNKIERLQNNIDTVTINKFDLLNKTFAATIIFGDDKKRRNYRKV